MQINNLNLIKTHAERNYGIDLLRLVAMFMVVVLHVLGQGGVLINVDGLNFNISWLLEIVAYCAVDCYAIISGYVYYSEGKRPHHYKKFLKFWVQVFTYSFGVTLIAFVIKPSIGIRILLESLVPVATTHYWYVSAYIGLFFMIPWLNKMLQSCSKQEATKLVFMIAIVFVIYVTFVSQSGVIFSIGNVFSLENGFSFVWLLILYIIGAWIKKCDVSFCLKNCTLLIGIVACVLLAWVTKIYFSTEIFISYISFNIVFIAFALVCIFSKLQLKQITQKIVICFAPASFGVYLIHQQKLIRAHFMYCAFTWIADLPCWLLVIAVLASAFCIYICCLIVEKIRLKLFCLLRIDKLIDNIATVIENLVLKIYSKGIKFYENSSNRS